MTFLKKLYLRYNYQSQKTKERLGENYCNTCESKKYIYIYKIRKRQTTQQKNKYRT